MFIIIIIVIKRVSYLSDFKVIFPHKNLILFDFGFNLVNMLCCAIYRNEH